MTTTAALRATVAYPAASPYIRAFSELRKQDAEVAGGKGANLGELTAGHFPVPEGYVITAQAYLHAMTRAEVRSRLRELAAEASPTDAASLSQTSALLRSTVQEAGIPDDLRRAILAAYRALGPDVRVAVRSSATSEDAAGTSFAGMNETFTNVQGETALIEKVTACWMSAQTDQPHHRAVRRDEDAQAGRRRRRQRARRADAVTPDAVPLLRRAVARAERRLMLDALVTQR